MKGGGSFKSSFFHRFFLNFSEKIMKTGSLLRKLLQKNKNDLIFWRHEVEET